MTVTVTGSVVDVTGQPDSRKWEAWSPVYREGTNTVVTVRPQPVRVVAGQFIGEFEPGTLLLKNPDGEKYVITVPEINANLWDLIEVSIGVPPETGADLLSAAVETFVSNNPGYPYSGLAGKPSVIAEGATPEEARAAIQAVSTGEMSAAVTAAVASAETVTDAAAAAVSTEIANRDLVETHDVLTDTYTWSLVDSNSRIALAVLSDGTVRISKLDPSAITDGTLTAAKLTTTVQSQLVAVGVGTLLNTVELPSGFVWAVTDSTGRVGLGVKTDGTLVGKFPTSATPTPLLPEVSGTTPSRKLWALNHTTGARTLITASDDPRDAVEDNGAILYTDNNGRKAYTSGTIIPAYPDRSVIACWGDSLTQNGGWPEQLNTDYPANVVNLGGSGHTSDEIAIRQGGYTLQLSVSGGSIPTSGPVTCTTAQSFVFSSGVAWTQTGTLAGVAGTLSRGTSDPSNTFTFTRTTSGSAVSVPGTTPFSSDAATTYESSIAIIAAGRNDHNLLPTSMAAADVAASVVAAHEAMVNRLKAYHKEYLILGTCTFTDATRGTFHYLRLRAINDALSARFGNRFCSYQNYLVTQAIYDLGITPTAGDLTAMAGDTMPPSITVNSGHFTSAAGAAMAEAVLRPKLDQLGWTL